jgi:hypothetical protein
VVALQTYLGESFKLFDFLILRLQIASSERNRLVKNKARARWVTSQLKAMSNLLAMFFEAMTCSFPAIRLDQHQEGLPPPSFTHTQGGRWPWGGWRNRRGDHPKPTDIDPENRLKIATFLVETHFPTPIWQSLCSMTRGVTYEFQFWVNDFRHWIGSDECVQAII